MPNPKRETHELKTDQPAGHKRDYQPSTRASPKRRVGSAARTPESRASIATWPGLTGTWLGVNNSFYLHINQAGPHLELLVAFIESGSSSQAATYPHDTLRSQTRLVRMGGDRIDDEARIFQLYVEPEGGPVDDSSRACGTLQLVRQPTDSSSWRIDLDLELAALSGQYDPAKLAKLAAIAKQIATALTTQASLFERHIGDPKISCELRTHMWFPITHAQLSRLPSHVFGARIQLNSTNYSRGGSKAFGYIDLLRAYFVVVADLSLSKTVADTRCLNIAKGLDALVAQIYSDAKLPTPSAGGIDDFYLPYWRVATLTTLANETLKVKGDAVAESLREHTDYIMDRVESFFDFPSFAKLLGIGPPQVAHYYEIVIEVIDLDKADIGKVQKYLAKKLKRLKDSILGKIGRKIGRLLPVGGIVGAAKITKLEPPWVNPDPDRVPEWEGEYIIAVGGVKLARGAGGGSAEIKGSGAATSTRGGAWKPHRLDGEALLFECGASISGGGGGKGASAGYLTCHGSGSSKPPPLQFDMSGLSDISGLFPGASTGCSGYGGYLWYLDADFDPTADIYAPPDMQSFAYGFHAETSPLHFDINEARLRDEAKHLLQTFAASELALLTRESVSLNIEGSADQPGNELENELLSRNRAISVFVYLKNLLEGDLPLKELQAIPADEKTELADIRSQRELNPDTPIFIPGHDNVTLIAHGEPASSPGGELLYDQDYRRALVTIDNAITLSLRRMKDT